jgi:alginate O-acetyltransferase complex protein AlgI
MNAYLPCDETVAWLIVAVWGLIVLAGLLITRLQPGVVARCSAWALAILSVVGLDRMCAAEPAGVRMVALIVGLFFAMKAVVSVEASAAGQPALSPLRWLGFTLLWPGMRPCLFASPREAPLPAAGSLARLGFARMAAGLAVILLARLLWVYRPAWLTEEEALFLVTMFLLFGIGLELHFGIFNVLAGLWRWAGIDCRPLSRTPLWARSLTEFWGRRWNLAFSEMTTVAIYRPLARHLGAGTATFMAFLFSGLVHEAAISLPVGAGYGLPMLYFTLHGLLVLAERRWEGLARLDWLGHAWTLSWLALPLPLLFHPYFLKGVVWPILGIEPTIEPAHLAIALLGW